MKNNHYTGGFTLIELLVVVLIIGILSSVALPQYTKAVEKSRATEGMTYAEEWIKAQQIYHMANGKFATNDADLDIAFPALKNFTAESVGDSSSARLLLERTSSSSMPYTLFIYTDITQSTGMFTIERECYYNEKICQALEQGSGWNYEPHGGPSY